MARAGMALRRGIGHGNTEGDDVQRSIELLDKVLSEFDDVENANQVQNIQQISTSVSTPQLCQTGPNSALAGTVVPSGTPDDESPSLGHQSEDDGYMSMNGRKPKFNLAFKPLPEVPIHHENAAQSPTATAAKMIVRPGEQDDFPPPPEEAQRLIATLLPKVSPGHRPKMARGFPLTQLPVKIETIPPPRNFQTSAIEEYTPIINGLPDPIHSATQTTLPKTRHQRPYGWESNDFTLHPPPPPPGYRFGSLPFQHGMYPITSPTRVPPRTIPTALERHREVRRRGSGENDLPAAADEEHFSDDSLEEFPPPPPPPSTASDNNNKRASIAWEVSLQDDEALLTPGSTKVIGGRRRRKSGSFSSTSSIPNRLKELEDWPDPPVCTNVSTTEDDDVTSPLFSDSDDLLQLPPELNNANLSGTGTYIVRRGKKKDRNKLAVNSSSSSLNSRLSSDLSIPRYSCELSSPNSRFSVDLNREVAVNNSPKSRLSLDLNNSRLLPANQDFKKHSCTFDNLRSLIREGAIVDYAQQEEVVSDLDNPSVAPQIVRVVSLPSLTAEEFPPPQARRDLLDVTVEEEEDADSSSQPSAEISPLRKIERNISELLERRDFEIVEDVLNGVESLNKNKKRKAPPKPIRENKPNELQKSSSHNEIQRCEDYYRQLLIDGGNPFQNRRNGNGNGIQKSESAKEMLIAHREVVRMPTSTSADFPVRVEVLQHDFPPLPPSPVEECDEYSEIVQNLKADSSCSSRTKSSEPPSVPPHSTVSNSLKTRSMDANYNRAHHNRRNNFHSSSNIRNIPERRTLPNDLPESKRRPFHKRASHSPQEEHHLQTSCSLPETPIFARGCDVPRTPHRRAPDVPGNQTAPRQSNTIGSLNTIGNMSTGGYSRRGVEQAIVGAELLRLAGGPGRGWYPKQRHRRPASIEHLDRMASGHNPWEAGRKPLTLPPNLTPKFFQRSPRDALRRVTSLLIRKGNNGSKEPRKEKEIVSPTIHENANGPEEVQKKKGFFKSFWKRSRHYSLEQQ